jgi:glycosyltransferase involved in cell wall biosynthesis
MRRSYIEARRVAHRCDVFNAHFAPYAIGPALALRSTGVPTVCHFHGPWAGEGWVERRDRVRFLAKRVLERLVYRRAAAFVTMSGAFKSLLVEQYGVDPCLVHVVPPGVDHERFHPGRGRAAARSRLGLPARRPLVLAVRRLVRRTGLDLLLEAVREAVRERPELLLLVGGQGPLRQALDVRIRALGLESNVRLLGFVPEEQLPEYYRAADVVAVPSLALEGFGLVTLEALSCGTPVVATPVGGTPEILSGLEARLLTRDVSAPALAEGLLAVLDGASWVPDPARCQGFVGARYSWPRAVEALERLFEGTHRASSRAGSPTRVAYVNSDPEVSGAEINLLQTVEAVPRDRVTPLFVVPSEGEVGERVAAAGFPAMAVPLARARLGRSPVRLGLGLLALVAGAWRVGRALRDAGVDLVHANSIRAGLMVSLGRVLHRRPVIWSAHDFLPGGVIGAAVGLAARVGASMIIANSDAVLEDMGASRWVIPRLRRIYPVLPTWIFEERKPGLGRAAWGIREDAFVVGYVGQITPWKRVHDAITAFGIAAAEVPGSRLIIAGAAKFRPENRQYLEALLDLARQRWLEDRILFVGFQGDLLRLYGALDVLLHPAAREPFGRVVAEAMAQGLPVVATAEGGVPEIVQDGVTGFLCRRGDVESMGRSLVKLARAPELRRQLGAAGVQRARACFHVDQAVRQLLDVYVAVLTAYRGRPAPGRSSV